MTNSVVSTSRDGKVVYCYARVDPRSNKWTWGCVKPDSKGMARIVMGLVGKTEKPS